MLDFGSHPSASARIDCRPHRTGRRATRVFAPLALVLAASCAPVHGPAPITASVPVWPRPAPVVASVAESCPQCVELRAEIARLRLDLSTRDNELRELRAQQREQARALEESSRQAVRAKVKLRRLASQADAASAIAEAEVALGSARASPTGAAAPSLLGLAEEILKASEPPFAQGDYDGASDLAAHASQILTAALEPAPRASGRGRPAHELAFESVIPLRVKSESVLRQQPADRSATAGALKEGTLLVAVAARDQWLRVETDDGRSGWIAPGQLGTR